MSQLIHLDGALVAADEARVSVYDHGLLYGDGIYEGMRCYGGVVFQAAEHLRRLYRSAKCLRLDLPSPDEIWSAIAMTVRANELDDAYIRLLVTRGVGRIGPDPATCGDPRLVVIVEPTPPLHGEGGQRGLAASIVSTRRNPVDAVSGQVKSLNYLGSVVARMEARAAGADEAIMLDSRGMVAEAPVCNLVLVHDGRLSTPGEASGVLRGITRDFVLGIAADEGMDVAERDVTPMELLTADEVLVTGTHAELVPIVSVNGVEIGDGTVGPVFATLLARFRSATSDAAFGRSVARTDD